MQDKLLLIHEYLRKIIHISTEEEYDALTEKYRSLISPEGSDETIKMLWQDGCAVGKELVCLKTSGADASRSRRLAALTTAERAELAEAERVIDENRFGYHFQPIVNTVDGEIYSYEALMRPQSELCPKPFHILKYAELTGRLNDIERATFLNILNIIDTKKEKFGGRRVFINSIPKTKLNGEDFRRVGELLMKHSDTAVVELTEQAEPDETELNALKERYQNMDVKIAIDDYGTGYSNVKNLLRYMPQYVKIDRSLLSEIQDSPKKRHFVREIIEFCHDNGIMALAEGVETYDELRSVILLGADLIQGFYTARPSAEVIDAIPYEIRQEIKRCQLERQDGKDQQIYTADMGERVLLDKLVKDDYRCILIGGSGDVTVVGTPTLDTEIHIEVARGFNGNITLENVRLSNVKSRPCIDIGEDCEVTLTLLGENSLQMGGICVPASSSLTFKGDGKLNITIDTPEFYAIGNGILAEHGELIFDQSGCITVDAHGQTGVAIGSGNGGKITIVQGQYVLNISGDTGVGIGALYADSTLDIQDCDISTDISLSKGVTIGSLGADGDVHIHKASAKLYLAGLELVGIGSVAGERSDVLINDASVIVNIRADRCSAIAALDGRTHFRVERAGLRITAGGDKVLALGGFTADSRLELINADTTIKLETSLDVNDYVTEEMVEIVSGRTRFIINGEEIE